MSRGPASSAKGKGRVWDDEDDDDEIVVTSGRMNGVKYEDGDDDFIPEDF